MIDIQLGRLGRSFISFVPVTLQTLLKTFKFRASHNEPNNRT